ncbi:MAG: porin [Alphaproteobacteria bacterium]|nr:porin [Alphaproteobacteria bacterium]
MKKFLLSGVALGAIGFVAALASPAQAQDVNGVQLKLGGYFKGYINYADQDEVAGQEIHSVDILRQTEVHFDGKTTLDNGLTVGAHIEGRVDVGDDFTVDETYMFFSGDWGRVNFGGTYGTPYILQVVAPSADTNVDGRLQLFNPINFTVAGLTGVGETDYDHDVSAKSDKLSYISPVYSGFQAGVSYTPDSDNSRSLTGNAADNDDTTASSDIWDFAARYENKISNTVNYRFGAGYTVAQVETGANDDRQAWNAGLDFNIGDFGVGATYQVDDLGDATDDAHYTVVGVDYTMGSVVYGASYYNKDDNVNTVDFDRYSVGATYTYGPGMTFNSSVGYYDIAQGALDVNATAVMIGTDIKF